MCPSLRISGQLPAPIVNSGRDSFWKWLDFQLEGLVTLTLDWVILHTIVHHSSTLTYMPNVTENRSNFCGRTYVRTDGHLRPALSGQLYQRVDLKKENKETLSDICEDNVNNNAYLFSGVYRVLITSTTTAVIWRCTQVGVGLLDTLLLWRLLLQLSRCWQVLLLRLHLLRLIL